MSEIKDLIGLNASDIERAATNNQEELSYSTLGLLGLTFIAAVGTVGIHLGHDALRDYASHFKIFLTDEQVNYGVVAGISTTFSLLCSAGLMAKNYFDGRKQIERQTSAGNINHFLSFSPRLDLPTSVMFGVIPAEMLGLTVGLIAKEIQPPLLPYSLSFVIPGLVQLGTGLVFFLSAMAGDSLKRRK